jgi:predicted amidohydrolase YtcJ
MNQVADILITNGTVFTSDPALPWAQAVAIKDNRVVFVGNNAEAQAWRGAITEVVDAGGRAVLPGFIDSHFHLLWGSLKLAGLQLDHVATMDELATEISTYADAHPHIAWITGYQLRYNVISKEQPLDRYFLDALAPGRFIYLTAYDGHTVWANTRALQAAQLLYGAETPAGSEIVMEPSSGTTTGELREPGAFNLLRALLPVPDLAQKRALLQKGLARAASFGITSVHNMDGDEEQIRLYAALEDAGEMSLRVYVPYSVTPETPLEMLEEAKLWREQYTGTHIRAGLIKLFMDGVLESYTALMHDDYATAAGNRGSALFSARHFNDIAVAADRLGLQIAVHACGDGAVRRALDGYAVAQQENGRRDSRHRVEHIEVIHPDDLARFAELGVIASMQPYHVPLTLDEGDVWPSRVGAERWHLSFAWETLRQAGAHLAYGSDWPVMSMNPMLGIHAALNRQLWSPGLPVQTQNLAAVLAGYTRDAAYAEFQENRKGRLQSGMLADVVVLSENLFTLPKQQVRDVHPLVTICDGKVVYRKST